MKAKDSADCTIWIIPLGMSWERMNGVEALLKRPFEGCNGGDRLASAS